MKTESDRDEKNDPKAPHVPPAAELRRERQRGMDKTLADSHPASDPPSSIPDPPLETDESSDQAA